MAKWQKAIACTVEQADLNADAVELIYGNAIHTHRPIFFAACGTHLDGDQIKALIPSGYKVLCRLDRNQRGARGADC